MFLKSLLDSITVSTPLEILTKLYFIFVAADPTIDLIAKSTLLHSTPKFE